MGVKLYFLPVQTRMPLKFGAETLTSVTCARACVVVSDRAGRTAEGWGETPLSVQWVWPSQISYESRHSALRDFTEQLAFAWATFDNPGHPLEIGADFQQRQLPALLAGYNRSCPPAEKMPLLAALVCCSPFDIALHDAYGQLLGRPTYETYTSEFMSRDLAGFLEPAAGSNVSFAGRYPADYLAAVRDDHPPVWHLVGGLDALDSDHVDAPRPDDDEPYLLDEWIDRDGLECLKIKLRGNDLNWDYDRLVAVSRVGFPRGVRYLTADFNCTVRDPAYVNEVLDRLRSDEPAVYDSILYVEQPFPYELEHNQLDVASVSQRKPLLMDESAHNWQLVRLGRTLGWTGVALKTCKTQTGALLSLCWAKAHGMYVMVQDLTNPMLAQVPHVLLAAHAETMMGVESNAMQFYPAASRPEMAVHPGIYRRRGGRLDLSTLCGPGFGYRLDEIARELPTPAAEHGQLRGTS
ncbi:MAG: mandelate racemase/muconate lactonizing enzyme family protein [Planctomycetales bacterium]|nr:mandelate racemase/muconate lactonizing enzyme family protein [Planctomycetales bacterium]